MYNAVKVPAFTGHLISGSLAWPWDVWTRGELCSHLCPALMAWNLQARSLSARAPSKAPGYIVTLYSKSSRRSPDDVTLSLMVAIWLHVQLPSQRCGEGQVQSCTHKTCCFLAPLRPASVHRGASQLY